MRALETTVRMPSAGCISRFSRIRGSISRLMRVAAILWPLSHRERIESKEDLSWRMQDAGHLSRLVELFDVEKPSATAAVANLDLERLMIAESRHRDNSMGRETRRLAGAIKSRTEKESERADS